MIPCGEKTEEVACLGAKGELEKSYLKFTAIVCKDSSAARMGRELESLLNLVFKSKCIHGQKKKPSVSAQKGSKYAFLMEFSEL